jgi:O-antigen ligase
MMYISFLAVFFFCGSCIDLPEIKTAVIRFFVLISFITAVFALVDMYLFPIPSFHYMWDYCMPGVFNNPNHYAYYLTIMIMLSTGMFLYEKSRSWQIAGLVSAVVHCAVLVLNDTFGSYLAVWAGFLFFIVTGIIVYKKFPLKVMVPAAALVLFSLVLTTWQGSMSDNFVNLGNDVSNIAAGSETSGLAGTSRWVLWTTAVEGILESPVFGQGVEGWVDILLKRSSTGIHAHNEYLQYALFFGIPALICYVGGILAVFIRGLKHRRIMDGYTLMALAAVFGYCVSAFFGNPKYYTAPFMFAVLGLGYNCLREKKDAEKKNDAGDHSSAANS